MNNKPQLIRMIAILIVLVMLNSMIVVGVADEGVGTAQATRFVIDAITAAGALAAAPAAEADDVSLTGDASITGAFQGMEWTIGEKLVTDGGTYVATGVVGVWESESTPGVFMNSFGIRVNREGTQYLIDSTTEGTEDTAQTSNGAPQFITLRNQRLAAVTPRPGETDGFELSPEVTDQEGIIIPASIDGSSVGQSANGELSIQELINYFMGGEGSDFDRTGDWGVAVERANAMGVDLNALSRRRAAEGRHEEVGSTPVIAGPQTPEQARAGYVIDLLDLGLELDSRFRDPGHLGLLVDSISPGDFNQLVSEGVPQWMIVDLVEAGVTGVRNIRGLKDLSETQLHQVAGYIANGVDPSDTALITSLAEGGIQGNDANGIQAARRESFQTTTNLDNEFKNEEHTDLLLGAMTDAEFNELTRDGTIPHWKVVDLVEAGVTDLDDIRELSTLTGEQIDDLRGIIAAGVNRDRYGDQTAEVLKRLIQGSFSADNTDAADLLIVADGIQGNFHPDISESAFESAGLTGTLNTPENRQALGLSNLNPDDLDVLTGLGISIEKTLALVGTGAIGNRGDVIALQSADPDDVQEFKTQGFSTEQIVTLHTMGSPPSEAATYPTILSNQDVVDLIVAQVESDLFVAYQGDGTPAQAFTVSEVITLKNGNVADDEVARFRQIVPDMSAQDMVGYKAEFDTLLLSAFSREVGTIGELRLIQEEVDKLGGLPAFIAAHTTGTDFISSLGGVPLDNSPPRARANVQDAQVSELAGDNLPVNAYITLADVSGYGGVYQLRDQNGDSIGTTVPHNTPYELFEIKPLLRDGQPVLDTEGKPIVLAYIRSLDGSKEGWVHIGGTSGSQSRVRWRPPITIDTRSTIPPDQGFSTYVDETSLDTLITLQDNLERELQRIIDGDPENPEIARIRGRIARIEEEINDRTATTPPDQGFVDYVTNDETSLETLTTLRDNLERELQRIIDGDPENPEIPRIRGRIARINVELSDRSSTPPDQDFSNYVDEASPETLTTLRDNLERELRRIEEGDPGNPEIPRLRGRIARIEIELDNRPIQLAFWSPTHEEDGVDYEVQFDGEGAIIRILANGEEIPRENLPTETEEWLSETEGIAARNLGITIELTIPPDQGFSTYVDDTSTETLTTLQDNLEGELRRLLTGDPDNQEIPRIRGRIARIEEELNSRSTTPPDQGFSTYVDEASSETLTTLQDNLEKELQRIIDGDPENPEIPRLRGRIARINDELNDRSITPPDQGFVDYVTNDGTTSETLTSLRDNLERELQRIEEGDPGNPEIPRLRGRIARIEAELSDRSSTPPDQGFVDYVTNDGTTSETLTSLRDNLERELQRIEEGDPGNPEIPRLRGRIARIEAELANRGVLIAVPLDATITLPADAGVLDVAAGTTLPTDTELYQDGDTVFKVVPLVGGGYTVYSRSLTTPGSSWAVTTGIALESLRSGAATQLTDTHVFFNGEGIALSSPDVDEFGVFYDGEMGEGTNKRRVRFYPGTGNLYEIGTTPASYTFGDGGPALELRGGRYYHTTEDGKEYVFDPSTGSLMLMDEHGRPQPVDASIIKQTEKEKEGVVDQPIGENLDEFENIDEANANKALISSEQSRREKALIFGAILHPTKAALELESLAENWRGKDISAFQLLGDDFSSAIDGFYRNLEGGVSTAICKRIHRGEELLLNDYPGAPSSGTNLPPLGSPITLTGLRSEYLAGNFTRSDCYFQSGNPKWFPVTTDADPEPLGFLYRFQWRIQNPYSEAQVEEMPDWKREQLGIDKNNGSIYYRVIMKGTGCSDTSSEYTLPSEDSYYQITAGTADDQRLAYYDLVFIENLCIEFKDWKYNGDDLTYPKNCKKPVNSDAQQAPANFPFLPEGTTSAVSQTTSGGFTPISGTGSEPTAGRASSGCPPALVGSPLCS